MAGVALGGGGSHFGGLVVAEAEEGPVTLGVKARFIFDVNLHAHHFGVLELAGLVDGTFIFGAANFEDEHGFVWPRAGLLKSLVGVGIHKNIVEHVVIHGHGGVVAHVETSRKVHPFAVVGGRAELAIRGVGRLDDGRGRRLVDGIKGDQDEGTDDQEKRFDVHG